MNTPEEIQLMLEAKSYCVIGASRNPEKYGYKVFRSIKSEGKTVYPVNPNAELIGQTTCYPSVRELPETVNVAVLIVPPSIVAEQVPACVELGIRGIWMQPGAVSNEAIQYCESNGIPVVAGECIMTKLWNIGMDDDM